VTDAPSVWRSLTAGYWLDRLIEKLNSLRRTAS